MQAKLPAMFGDEVNCSLILMFSQRKCLHFIDGVFLYKGG